MTDSSFKYLMRSGVCRFETNGFLTSVKNNTHLA